MYKKTLLLLLLFVAGLGAQAQTMREVVKQMPDTIVPLLTRNNLLDFPDYIDSQMKAELTNRLMGTSEMLQLTDDYTAIQLSKSSTLQLKLLPQGKKKIICLVRTYTVNDSIGDSQIQFYTTAWKPLPPSKFLNLKKAPQDFMQATLSAADNSLRLAWRYPLDVTFQGEAPREHVAQPAEMQWNGKKYVPMPSR